MMKIRPHHFLCIQMFTGHGYDEKFTFHMSEVKERLCDRTEIVVCKGCDEICTECPHKELGKCHEFDKVLRLDEDVMKVCGLAYGDKTVWKHVVSVVNDQIFKTNLFDSICHECEWYFLCREIKEKRWEM